MKQIIILALVCLAGWQIYSKQNAPTVTNADLNDLNVISEKFEESYTFNNKQYECDGRQHCSQMTSCEEAKFFILNCPNTKMDGDRDGIPCESQHCK